MKFIIRLAALFFLNYSILTSASEGDISNLLPENDFENLQVIHKMKFPYENKVKIDMGYYYLYGDKFVNSQGVSVSGSFFFSNSLAAKASLYLLKSSESEEVTDVQKLGITPNAYGPDAILRLSGVYRPVYGKLIFGNYVQRLFLGIEGGVNISRERSVVEETQNEINENSEIKIGPIIGIDLLLPLTKRVDINFNVHYFTHKRPFTKEDRWKLFWGNSLSLGYRF